LQLLPPFARSASMPFASSTDSVTDSMIEASDLSGAIALRSNVLKANAPTAPIKDDLFEDFMIYCLGKNGQVEPVPQLEELAVVLF